MKRPTRTPWRGLVKGLCGLIFLLATGALAQPVVIPPLEPSEGPVGTTVRINGVNFGDPVNNQATVTFNGVRAAMATVQSNVLITAVVPAGATTGLVQVTTQATGTSPVQPPFTVLIPPRIESFDPTAGIAGTRVRINGVGFARATGVGFGGLSAAFDIVSDSQISATVPANATTGAISVTNPLGSAMSGQSFLIARPPSIASFAPTSGPAGTEVTITGANLLTTSAVRFNGVNASFTVISDTMVRARVPDNGSTGRIMVVNPAASATSNTDFTVVRLPKINSFSPTSGPVGTPVTILGRNFATTRKVRFRANNVLGRVDAMFTVLPNDPAGMARLSTTVPQGAITGNIRIVNDAGGVNSDTRFTVTTAPPPAALRITPASLTYSAQQGGSNPAGQALTIESTGNELNYTLTDNAPWLNQAPGSGTTPSTANVTADISGLATGIYTATITVSATGVMAVNVPVTLTVTAAAPPPPPPPPTSGLAVTPAALSFTATAGGANPPGKNLSISRPLGAALTWSASDNAPWLTLAPATGTTPGSSTATVNVAGLAAGSYTATITVAAAGVPSVAVPVSLTVGPGACLPPAISSLSPASGVAGTLVTIGGANFTGTTGVRFGSLGVPFTLLSANQVRANVPSGLSAGPVQVTVTTPCGTASAVFSVIPPPPTCNPPVITSLTPASGQAGTLVTISGANFTGTTGVRFGTLGVPFTLLSANQVRANVPSGLPAGPAQVTVTTPCGSASGTFTVSSPPPPPPAGPTITVTSPNGGTFQVGQTVNIQWSSTGATSHRVQVSTDGFNFSPIVTGLSASTMSFAWTIPANFVPAGQSSVSATLKVIARNDTSGLNAEDVSNSPITIQAGDSPPPPPSGPTVTVTSPNGGTFQVGQTVNIQWSSTGATSHRVQVSTDGFTFNPIVTGLSASTMSFAWAIPANFVPAGQTSVSATLKVIARNDTLGVNAEDVSNSPITIQAGGAPPPPPPPPGGSLSVQVTFPNGGQFFTVGQTVSIQWTSTGATSHRVQYSRDGGASFTPIITGLPATQMSYGWTIPASVLPTLLSEAEFLIRVVARNDTLGTTAEDSSNGTITISRF